MLSALGKYRFAAFVVAGLGLVTALVMGKSLTSAVGAALAPGVVAKSAGGPGGPGGAAEVVATAVATRPFSDAIQALGTAQARESIIITPKTADTIRAIRFDSGDRVRRGQVLVAMSSVEQAADYAEAQAANEAAQEELRRAQTLFERGFASQARLDQVRSAADAAQARLNAGGSRIEDRTLRAPFDGVVGLRTASPGQFVRPGDQIGTLDDLSEIKLDFDVPETQMARLALGAQIVAHTAAFPDVSFEGVIANIDSRVEPASRTVRVRALLPNPNERLRPGMLLTVEVHANAREALAVPEIAILDRADGAFVYRVKAGEQGGEAAELVRIETGTRADGFAEVVSGLDRGDRIVTEGVQTLRPGAPVRLRAEAAAEEQPVQPQG